MQQLLDALRARERKFCFHSDYSIRAGNRLRAALRAALQQEARQPKAAQAPAEAQAALPEPPVPAQQPNPVLGTLSNMVGALTGLIPSATR